MSNGYIGKFQVLAEVGRGGMGIVYKALNPDTQGLVAIKMLLPQFASDHDVVSRFKAEAIAAARLRHPNIVHIYDASELNGSLCIVMEYLDGVDLDRLIPPEGLRDWNLVRRIALQIGEALHHAHRYDVVHRDVKPSNVIVDVDRDYRAVLTDFGIAKVRSSSLTASGTVLGTPEFMSPEQVLGNVQVDARTDMYSLGAVMFTMLAGRPPFRTDQPYATMRLKVETPPPYPSEVARIRLPEDLETITLRLLQIDPSRRFTTDDEYLVALREQTPVQLPPRAVPPPVAAPQPAPEISAGGSVRMFCTYCGTELYAAPEDRFCIWCGKPLPERPEPAPGYAAAAPTIPGQPVDRSAPTIIEQR